MEEINSLPDVSSGLIAAGAAMSAMGVVLAIVWFVLQVIAYWKIFKKAGKPGWHSIIPLLHTWDEIDLSWSRTMAWVFLALTVVLSIMQPGISAAQQNGENTMTFGTVIFAVLGIIALILAVMSEYKLAKAFGKGFVFFIGLLLLNPIFKLILGFGDAQYQGRQG